MDFTLLQFLTALYDAAHVGGVMHPSRFKSTVLKQVRNALPLPLPLPLPLLPLLLPLLLLLHCPLR